MKITKRQLKRIIKEEKARLVREMNPDGTISDGEDEMRDDFLTEVEMKIDELMEFVHASARRIGGDFRAPGIRAQAKDIILAKVKAFRKR